MSLKCSKPYGLQLRAGEWKCCKTGLGCVAPTRVPTLLGIEMFGPGMTDVQNNLGITTDTHSPPTNEQVEACKGKTCRDAGLQAVTNAAKGR